jgi:small subunit ribosomal protein S16
VAVKIRLKRMGKVRAPHYRIVVVDSRKKRDGRVIEEIGLYHPKEDPSYISVVSERAQYWLGVGAQPSEAVAKLLKVTGDWQKFKGYASTEGTLRVAEPKRDKLEIFNEALKDSAGEPRGEAVTKRAAKKSAAKPAEDKAPAAEPAMTPAAEAAAAAVEPVETPAAESAETPAAETPAAETPAAETPAAETAAEETAPVPAAETPDGAADVAETAEAAEVDAEAKKDEA